MKRSSAILLAAGTLTAVVVAVAVVNSTYAVGAQARPSAASAQARPSPSGPTILGCPVLPADNIWNTPVDKLPVDPRSAVYLKTIGLNTKVHPDFGQDPLSGFGLTQIPVGTPRVHLDILYREESDLGDYPVPRHPLVEGGPDSQGDAHVLLLDVKRCQLFELYHAHFLEGQGWHVDSAAQFDLTSNALRDDGKTSADAAGLPILPGLMRYDEAAAGEIRHAIRFTVPKTQKAHVWPARHDASHDTDPSLPPMGIRLRLRADFDISSFPAIDQTILRAMKRYGIILADNGSAIYLNGIGDPRWNDDQLHQLGRVTGKDFEVVDESSLQMMESSGRVDPIEVENRKLR